MLRRHVTLTCALLLGLAITGGVPDVARAEKNGAGAARSLLSPVISVEALKSSGRVTFDWGDDVDYQVWRLQGFVFVRFSKPIATNVDQISGRLGEYFSEARLMADGRLLSLRAAPDIEIRHRKMGTAVLLSVTRDASAKPETGVESPEKEPKEARTPAAPEPVLVGFVQGETRDRLSFRWRETVDYTFGRTDSTAILVFKRAGSINHKVVARQLAPAGIGIDVRPLGNGTAVRLTFAKPVRLRDGRDGTSVYLDILPVADEPVAEAPKEAVPRSPGRDAEGADEGVVLRVARTEHGPQLAVRWPALVPAAVFRHAGDIWVVFGATHDFVEAGLKEKLSPEVVMIQKIVLDDATVFRMRTARPMWPVVEREGWEWRVTLADRPPPRSGGSMFVGRSVVANGRGRIEVRVGIVGSVISLPVESLGTTLQVLPLKAPGLGIEALHRFPQFRILESIQGLAIEPIADGVDLLIEEGEAVVTAPGGLLLSDPAAGRRPAPGTLERDG